MSRIADRAAKRPAGLALMLAVLLTILVIAAIRGGPVAGTPVAEPVPEPPRSGDCVTENLYQLGSPDEMYLRDGGGLTLSIEPCDGVRFGEVAHVLTVIPQGGSARESRDLTYSACGEPVRRYLGLPPRDNGSSMQPMVDPLVAVVGPTERQRAAGQTWAACIVYPGLTPGGARTVDHSVRDAWQRPADRWLVAACTDNLSVGKGTSCGLPHRFEGLSWAHGFPGATQESLDSWCREATAEAVGSSAPFDRGELAGLAVAVRDGAIAPLTGSQVVEADGDFDVFCAVTPTDAARRLTAPIRGLGDAPLPLS